MYRLIHMVDREGALLTVLLTRDVGSECENLTSTPAIAEGDAMNRNGHPPPLVGIVRVMLLIALATVVATIAAAVAAPTLLPAVPLIAGPAVLLVGNYAVRVDRGPATIVLLMAIVAAACRDRARVQVLACGELFFCSSCQSCRVAMHASERAPRRLRTAFAPFHHT